eukprot:3668003-Prymnesium_polylepis.1
MLCMVSASALASTACWSDFSVAARPFGVLKYLYNRFWITALGTSCMWSRSSTLVCKTWVGSNEEVAEADAPNGCDDVGGATSTRPKGRFASSPDSAASMPSRCLICAWKLLRSAAFAACTSLRAWLSPLLVGATDAGGSDDRTELELVLVGDGARKASTGASQSFPIDAESSNSTSSSTTKYQVLANFDACLLCPTLADSSS